MSCVCVAIFHESEVHFYMKYNKSLLVLDITSPFYYGI